MSREYPSSTSTSAVSEPAAALKLPLHQALASLSVDLDAELIRYRQSRQGEATSPTPKGLTFRKRRKPIDLIRVEGKSEVKPMPQPAVTPAAPAAPPPLPPNPRLLQPSPQQGYSPVPDPLDPAHFNPAVLVPTQAPPPPTDGGALTSYSPVPDDYLESTEALLNADASGEFGYAPQDTTYEPSLLKSLTTPLGIGALLLLLVSSAGFGYLLTNPKAIGHIWNLPTVQALRGQSPSASGTAAGDNNFEPGLQGLGPDLSQEEFVDLNLGRLSTLPSQETSVPTVASTPTAQALPPVAVQPGTVPTAPSAPTPAPATAQQSTPPAAQPRTVVSPPTTIAQVPITVPPRRAQSAPAPSRSTPAPARPAPSRPAPAAPPRPAAPVQTAPPPLPAPAAETAAAQPASPNYYVVTDFTGDQSLSTARSAVGGAYVRNFPAGARIQMGAFADESSADSLVQELQQQGIPAEVYTP